MGIFDKDDVKKCSSFTKDVAALGFGDIENAYDAFAEIAPYINEISNIITCSITKPYFNFSIYPHEPSNFKKKILKDLIDMVAIFGIASNASKYGKKDGEFSGLIKGIIITIFSFLIPNLIMYHILKKIKKNYLKFIVGIIIVYLLDFTANLMYCIFLSRPNSDSVPNIFA